MKFKSLIPITTFLFYSFIVTANLIEFDDSQILKLINRSTSGLMKNNFKLEDLKRVQNKGISVLKGYNTPYSEKAFQEMFSEMHKELRHLYPKKILKYPRWIFNTAGGALGQVAILSCSAKEYLIFFCAPIPTEAFTGRYKMDVYDFYLTGVIEQNSPGQFSTHKYYPGNVSYLKKGEAFNYKANGNNCMMEYAKGKVVSGFKFGITGPAKYITMDKASSRAQLVDCAKSALGRNKSISKKIFPNAIEFKTK